MTTKYLTVQQGGTIERGNAVSLMPQTANPSFKRTGLRPAA